jgi:hypothetical protein
LHLLCNPNHLNILANSPCCLYSNYCHC